MKRRSTGEWFIATDTADPARSVNRSLYAYRRGAKSAIRDAEHFAADYGASRVTISHNGQQAGVFTGALWVQITDPVLARALDAREQ